MKLTIEVLNVHPSPQKKVQFSSLVLLQTSTMKLFLKSICQKRQTRFYFCCAKTGFTILAISTGGFTDVGKLNLLMVVQFRLEPIYTTAPAASKNKARFKRHQI